MNTLPSIEAGVPVLGTLLPLRVTNHSPQEQLNLISLIYQRALEALVAIEIGSFISLDASAGDQACQIRALKLSLIDLGVLTFIKEIIQEKIDKIETMQNQFLALNETCREQVETIETEVLKPLSRENKAISQERINLIDDWLVCHSNGVAKSDPEYKEINRRFALRFKEVEQKKQPALEEINALKETCLVQQSQLIEGADLELNVDPDVVFVVQCYLVTLVKVEIIRKEMGSYIFETHSNPKTLNASGFVIPSKALVDIIDSAKEAIRSGSISFIQEQVISLLGARGEKLQQIVEQPRFIESKGREELPFFHLTQVIFQRAMQLQVPLLLKVRNEASHPLDQEGFGCSVLFKSDGNTFEVSQVLPEDLSKRVIVIEAFSKRAFENLVINDYLDEVLENSGGLLRLIDLNTAQHGQFTDQIVGDFSMFRIIPGIDSPEEDHLSQLFSEAVEKGFSSANPELLCIEHVFCDLLANQRRG